MCHQYNCICIGSVVKSDKRRTSMGPGAAEIQRKIEESWEKSQPAISGAGI
jgi:hypothetical protein